MDHRVEQSFNLQKLLTGDMEEFVMALETRDIAQRIEIL